jgi:hypothetical protein
MEFLSRAQSDLRAISDEASTTCNRVKNELTALFESEIVNCESENWLPSYPNYFLKVPPPINKEPLNLKNKWEQIIDDYQSKIFRGNSPLRLQHLPLGHTISSTKGLEEKIRALDEQNRKLREEVAPASDFQAHPPQEEEGFRPLPSHTPAPAPFSLPSLHTSPQRQDQYDLSPWEDSDADAQKSRAEREEEKRERRAKKHVPAWCKTWQADAKRQNHADPDGIFFSLKKFPKCDLQVIFGASEKLLKKRRRGSSGNWGIDGLTDLEIEEYKRKMGLKN